MYVNLFDPGTGVYTKDLFLERAHSDRLGDLMAVVSEDRLAYASKDKEEKVVHLCGMASFENLLTLRQPAKTWRSVWLPVEADSASGRLAVTESSKCTLDLFTKTGV